LDGETTCELCGEAIYRGFIFTDGTFVWRSGLVHYVENHNVKPPDRFIEHVLCMEEEMDNVESDESEWWDSNPYGDEPMGTVL